MAIPVHLGDPWTIKQVFLIVKENRTYDQVLGDDGRGNGDPTLTQFGAKVTPNHHALATQFPLIDNLYGGGTLSADGYYQSHSDVPSLERNLDHAYPNFQLQIPDQYAPTCSSATSPATSRTATCRR